MKINIKATAVFAAILLAVMPIPAFAAEDVITEAEEAAQDEASEEAADPLPEEELMPEAKNIEASEPADEVSEPLTTDENVSEEETEEPDPQKEAAAPVKDESGKAADAEPSEPSLSPYEKAALKIRRAVDNGERKVSLKSFGLKESELKKLTEAMDQAAALTIDVTEEEYVIVDGTIEALYLTYEGDEIVDDEEEVDEDDTAPSEKKTDTASKARASVPSQTCPETEDVEIPLSSVEPAAPTAEVHEAYPLTSGNSEGIPSKGFPLPMAGYAVIAIVEALKNGGVIC